MNAISPDSVHSGELCNRGENGGAPPGTDIAAHGLSGLASYRAR